MDQNSEQQLEVTVGDVTVIITDYKLLPVKDEKSPPASPSQQETTVKAENEQIIPPVFEEKVENGEREEKAVEINT